MNNKIFLVLGGARSGKSEFAEKLMYHSTGKGRDTSPPARFWMMRCGTV